MIDVLREKLLSFPQAADSLPDRPHLSTLHRWRMRGVRGVRLETVLVGGKRYTSTEALSRFFRATTAAAEGAPTPAAESRTDAIQQAEETLDAAGI